jgi:hypothetical protein
MRGENGRGKGVKINRDVRAMGWEGVRTEFIREISRFIIGGCFVRYLALDQSIK